MPAQGATLREQLEDNYDKIIAPAQKEQEARIEAVESQTEVKTEIKTDEVKTDTRTTEERARDEAGRFVKQEDKPAVKTEAKPAIQAGAPSKIQAAPVVEKLGVKRPDSWKKELWPIWDKLDAGETLTREERKLFLEYLPQREGEYLKGVSTYKAEWDRARPLLEALNPYQEMIQANQLRPEQFVSALAATHQALTAGDAPSKLRAFAKFARDYQIPLQDLFVQGEDGKLYFNQQYLQREAPTAINAEEIKKQVLSELQGNAWRHAIQQFATAVDKDGKALHPHFETVRQTMDGLLKSGLSKDLAAAYEAALRLPQHSALFDAMQKETQAAADAQKQKEERERAERARANNLQPKTSTPTGSVDGTGKKGLRAALESAYDAHVTGRV